MFSGRWRGVYLATGIVFVLTAVLLGGAALFLLRGPAALAGPIAARLPPVVGMELGVRVMRDAWRPCREAGAEASLAVILYRLTRHFEPPVAIDLRVARYPPGHAFTAPGGHIVLAKRLIDLADHPDAVAGIVAHLIGHVRERHALAGLVRQLGPDGVLHYLRSDINGLQAALAALSRSVPTMAFGPAEEAAAEAEAVELMHRNGIDPQVRADVLTKALRSRPHTHELARLIARHPGLLARSAATGTPRPALNERQWRQLQAACSRR